MGKATQEPEITAAVISVVGTVIGTLLISIILGFLEGRIGLQPVVIIVAFLLLISILVLLFMVWGPRRAGISAAVMLAIGSVVFLISALLGLIPEQVASSTPGESAAESNLTGETAVVEDLKVTEAASASPTATVPPTPAPTATPAAVERFADDFNDPDFDGRFNPALWSLKRVESVRVRQEEGVLSLETLSAEGWGAVEFSPRDPAAWTPADFTGFQADLKLDSRRRGEGGLIKLQVIIPRDREDDWWIECQMKNSDPDRAWLFCNYYSGGPWVWPEGYEYFTETVEVPYDRWVTVRMGIDSETGELSFSLDGRALGTYQVRDQDAFQTAKLYPLLGAWVEAGDQLAGAFDNVSVGP